MNCQKRLFYFNALFDLKRLSNNRQSLKRTADEMTTLFVPMGRESDLILLHADVPDDYRIYLQTAGLSPPAFVSSRFSADQHILAHPWGWDEEALRLFSSMNISSIHPDPAIVQMVNNREFLSALSDKENIGAPGSTLIHNMKEFNILIAAGNQKYPAVIKPSHGSSGFGFILLSSPPDSSVLKQVSRLLQFGSVVVEPWYDRKMDISSSLTLYPNGSLSGIRHCRCYVDSHGTFYGVHLAPDYFLEDQQLCSLEQKICACARHLRDQGYFGPVGFDSFTYTDKTGHTALASIIEINARHVMSDIARELKQKLAPNRHVFYRLLSSRRCKLPDNYEALKKLLAPYHFSPETRKGILPVTPLKVRTDVTRQPYRNAFFISAENEDELFHLDAILLQRTSQNHP
ncbi:MAG: hypothetical protein ACLFVQ_08985 [Chitinispirillaceae bacterium]